LLLHAVGIDAGGRRDHHHADPDDRGLGPGGRAIGRPAQDHAVLEKGDDVKKLKVGTASAAKPGLATGVLRTGDLPDGEPITIPVMILKGESDGPVLWLHGCVHGDELCGAYIIHELMRSLDAKKLTGAVVALPILNITG